MNDDDGIRIAAMPDLGSVTDGSSFVGEYAGSGRFSASALRSYVQAGRHGVLRPSGGDDTAALQAAVTANLYGALELSAGTFNISSQIEIVGSIYICGAGPTTTTISNTTNNAICFNITSTVPVQIESMGIVPVGTGVTGIRVVPVSAANTESAFRDLHILGCGICIDTQNAASWVIEACHFENFTSVGVNVRCTANPDAGDSMISDCYFLSSATEICIQQLSSGGLKLSNNKFLNTLYGFALFLDANAHTGLLNITGNSFDGCLTAIELGQGGAGGTFHDVVISGNTFNLCDQAIGVTNGFATPGWIINLTISGNSVYLNAAGTAINLDGVSGFVIGECNFYTPGAGSTCINVTTHTSNGVINPCNRYGPFANYVLNVGNLVIVHPKIQSGSVSVSTTTAMGGLFRGAGGAVTFTYAYLGNQPLVTISPTGPGAAGAISGYASSVALDSFVPNVVGVNNTAAAGCTWTAMGDW